MWPYNSLDQSRDHCRTEEEDHQVGTCQEDGPLEEGMLEEQCHQQDLQEGHLLDHLLDHQEDHRDRQEDPHPQ